ncbi:MAG: N-6 DNA methylase [Bacilli bacterium]|nr:N-6 DNA methylase [Bacilli bacterium]
MNPNAPIEGPIEFECVIHRLADSKDPRIARYARFCIDQYQNLWYYMDCKDPDVIGPVTYAFVNGLSDSAFKELALQFFKEPKDAFKEFGTPESLCNLAGKILDVQKKETIVDLCSGRGDFLSQYADFDAYGFEINADALSFSVGICALNGSYPLFKQQDVLTLTHAKFDKVFCEYPWGIRYERPIQALGCENWKPLPVKDLKRSMMSWLFIAKALSLVDEKGIAVIHANNGALFSTYESDIRKEAVEKGLLKAVIALPVNIMEWTGVASSLLVFSRGNSSVRFIDGSTLGSLNKNRRVVLSDLDIERLLKELDCDETNGLAVSVSNEDILARGANLSPKAYLNPTLKVASIPNGKTIGDLGTEIIRGVVSNSRYLVKEAVSEYRVLSSSDIVDGRVDVSSLPYLTEEGIKDITQKALTSVLKDGDVVMTNKSTVIKTAVVETGGEKILLFGSLYGLRLDPNVMNPDYLCCFINSTVGQESLHSIQTGTVISMITVANLNSLVIPCPPIEEQNRFAEDIALTLEMIQDAKERIAKLQKRVAGSFDFLLTESV